ncbi:hypothetical protein EON63_04225 [archaeon]|nr:MAG: hypothetical protein EON63_04225 [archaeon]
MTKTYLTEICDDSNAARGMATYGAIGNLGMLYAYSICNMRLPIHSCSAYACTQRICMSLLMTRSHTHTHTNTHTHIYTCS